jgi:basic membrane lipoprotein Med (substrate-binding protein (PBP1-ABC) superfamily)/DNA-binding SARP family transcriptional activator
VAADVLDFRLLGALEVSANGAVADLGPPKQRALLAILLLHAGEIVPIDRLIDLLWGEQPPRTAAHSIQIYVSDLRRALESLSGARQVLATRAPGYQLDTDPEAIDARRFERLVEAGTRQLREGDPDGGAEALRSALRLWRGPALSDFAYEEFAQPYIRRFHDLHLDAIEQVAAAELEAGRVAEVVPMLDAAIREDPLRERSRELLMLALYRSGRHAESLRTYQQLRTTLVDELGLDPSPSLQRLQERILLHDPSLLPQPEQPASEASHRNPYKGLRSFTEADAPDFFGRDALVERLIRALDAGAHLVALVGPSGSGKSSAIAAGLIPRLREGAIPGSDRWVIAQMVPGTNPLAEVEAVVAAAAGVPTGLATLLDAEADPDGASMPLRMMPEGSRVLLVIDQFEELFTITDEVARRRFLDSIARAVSEPDTQITVLLSLRGDYYDRPLLHPEFAKVFTPGVENALPMTANELEAIVVGPAESGGVAVEPALLAELVADAADRPGTLPLLEFALTELFDQRTQAALTLDGYRALGGIRGVLSRSAEAIYDGLRADEQRVAMQVFLHLVQLGVGTTESRRRLPLADLTGLELDPVALSAVLEAFGRRRLLSFDRESTTQQATVEVAHESLFREWDRLAGWIDRHRNALQRYAALMAATDEWQGADRQADYLLTGTRLAEFETWIDDASVQITSRQREFITAGIQRRSMEQEAERSRAEAEHRMERRARTRLVALAGVIVLVVGATGYALWAGLLTDTPHVALLHSGLGQIDSITEAGFDRAISEFGLVGEDVLIDDFSNTAAELRALSEGGADLVVFGDAGRGAEEVPLEYPETRYVFSFPVEEAPNVSFMQLADNQSSYLAGVAAALKTQTGTIGFVGGVDEWFIWPFHAGYEAGARSVDPDIEVIYEYLGEFGDLTGFGDPVRAEAAARRLFEAGADVVFHAAGDSGVGVFEAATTMSTNDLKLWAIGVDSDQYDTVQYLSGAIHPEDWRKHILTSVIKRLDIAMYEVIADFTKGELASGKITFDLADRAVDISYSGRYLDDVFIQIEDAREQINDGTVIVPCVPEDRTELARQQELTEDYCWR